MSEAPDANAAFERQLISAFATPVMSYSWADSAPLNDALKSIILAAERQGAAGVTRSNVGGWHSGDDFLTWNHAAIRTVCARIGEMTKAMTRATTSVKEGARTYDYAFDGWANVSRHGNYHSAHNHPRCVWSGTYYVASGAPDPDGPLNGRLELLDPRAGANMMRLEGTMLEARYLVAPTPGAMVMFPAWLTHMVHPFYGAGERISIAFNVKMTERKGEAA